MYRKKNSQVQLFLWNHRKLSPETIPVVRIIIICSHCMTGSIRIRCVCDQYFYAIHDMNSTATFESDFNLIMTCAVQIPRQNNQGRLLTLERNIGLHNHKLWKVISRYELFCFWCVNVPENQKSSVIIFSPSYYLQSESWKDKDRF